MRACPTGLASIWADTTRSTTKRLNGLIDVKNNVIDVKNNVIDVKNNVIDVVDEVDVKNNVIDNDSDMLEMSIECLNTILKILPPNKESSAINKTYPNLVLDKTKQNPSKYDLYDKIYIEFVYGSLGDYDKQYCKEVKYKDDDETVRYFRNLNTIKKQTYVRKILEIQKDIKNIEETPMELQIVDSGMPSGMKIKAQEMYDNPNPKYKLWTERLLRIPFKKYRHLELDIKHSKKQDISNYLINSKKILDSVVYGHNQAKNQIIQMVSCLICNNSSYGNVFGIQGPMGNGKTTLLRNGLSKILKLPFDMIQLGGLTDSSYLSGHSFTYDGSQYGRIVSILMESKCMNPIIYFDELDKISKSEKGQEITGILTHLTDPSQNMNFQDKYFSGIDIDISKAIFIFSFNDINKVDPILLDRIRIIKTYGFKIPDKIKIAKQFLIKETCNNIGFEEKNVIFGDDCLQYIIKEFSNEEGVRNFKRTIETILGRLNFLSLITPSDYKKLNVNFKIKNFKLPIRLDIDTINVLLVDEKKYDKNVCSMYM